MLHAAPICRDAVNYLTDALACLKHESPKENIQFLKPQLGSLKVGAALATEAQGTNFWPSCGGGRTV